MNGSCAKILLRVNVIQILYLRIDFTDIEIILLFYLQFYFSHSLLSNFYSRLLNYASCSSK